MNRIVREVLKRMRQRLAPHIPVYEHNAHAASEPLTGLQVYNATAPL
ncbi:MAG: hypothetical protein KatS3mg019_0863 [Fimbriimonadales bacterium]|nr:MAG: hypothetical protein KatS3mg019_0863 [Fimbriimonadales bacterium]